MGVGWYVSVCMTGSMFVSDSVCVCVCEFAWDWQRQHLIRGGPALLRLEAIHNNLSDVVNVTRVIYGRHNSE